MQEYGQNLFRGKCPSITKMMVWDSGVLTCPMGGCRWQARVGSVYINFFFKVYIKVVKMINWKEACDTFMFCSAAHLSVEKCSLLYGIKFLWSSPTRAVSLCVLGCWSRGYRQVKAVPPPWPLSQGNSPGVCSSPTGAARQELPFYTLSINSTLWLWLWDMWMWFHGVQVCVQNILFRHFCECPDSFLVCAPGLLCCWLDVINLPWAKRDIIHTKKGVMLNSNKLSSTTFSLLSDKVTCHALY